MEIKKYIVGNVEVAVSTEDNLYFKAYDPKNEFCCKSYGIVERNGEMIEVNGGVDHNDMILTIAAKIQGLIPGSINDEIIEK